MNEANYILNSEQLSTAELHTMLLQHASALVLGETDLLANCANISSLVYHSLPSLNWCGFYFRQGDELVLGPFQGKPACTRIQLSKGVCGTAARESKTIVVEDVHRFDGHIACDPNSRSELVVPLLHNAQVIAVFDIDSPIPARFGAAEVQLCEELVGLLLHHSSL